ncbi:MAG: hypothetical protein EXQ70_02245 [Solirubrobacterales bacterium]|nr:hypothetical protein [Solirubrobacterales bacterium]
MPEGPDGRGPEHERVKQRWQRFGRRLPGGRWMLPDVCFYEDGELAAASPSILEFGLGSDPASGRAAMFGPEPPHDDAEIRARPGLQGPGADWRLLAGAERRPAAPSRDRQQLRIAAWLELQFWWRTAFDALASPGAPWSAYSCVKMVSEPARIWLTLAGMAPPAPRRELLEQAAGAAPFMESATWDALALLDRLPRAPAPRLATFLPHLASLSGRIAELIDHELAGAPRTEVRLGGAGGDELLPRREGALPFGDWRALVVPSFPDEALALIHGAGVEPDALVEAAGRATAGVTPAIRHDELMVLPVTDVWRGGILRAVQSRLTDPVSFALTEGAPSASFPEVAGWSAGDWARRAVGEHSGWLERESREQFGRPTAREWLDGEGDAAWPSTRAIAKLLTAARAGLFWESLESGSPELPLTVAATCRNLEARGGAEAEAVGPAFESYRVVREGGEDPPPGVVGPLRRVVEGLPAYAEADSGD